MTEELFWNVEHLVIWFRTALRKSLGIVSNGKVHRMSGKRLLEMNWYDLSSDFLFLVYTRGH